jgi:hypothetical protein
VDVRAQRDPDLLLVEVMSAPPPLDDARRSLEYWERRHKALPLYHRRARREAREMAARWDERVRAAELARFESSVAGRLVSWLGLSSAFVQRVRFTKWGLFSVAWVLVPRRFKLIAAGVLAAWVIVAIGALAALAAVLDRLA